MGKLLNLHLRSLKNDAVPADGMRLHLPKKHPITWQC